LSAATTLVDQLLAGRHRGAAGCVPPDPAPQRWRGQGAERRRAPGSGGPAL